ncbi:hypothetical protein ABKN59_011050 [Abortiporus biennis]
MPMPQTYSPCPRPILKRSSTTPAHAHQHQPDSELLAIDPSILSPLVRFPPSPSLARTFTAYSSKAYDRSPIVVSHNTCSLPERGCPGRTYVTSTSPPKSNSGNMAANGKSLHPRASHSNSSGSRTPRPSSPCGDEEEEDDDPTPMATPTSYPRALPALVRSSSSSSSSSSSEDDDEDSASDISSDFASLYISHSHPTFLPPSSPNTTISNRHSSRPTRSSSPHQSNSYHSSIPTTTTTSTSSSTTTTTHNNSSRPRSKRMVSPSTRRHLTTTCSEVVNSPYELQPKYKTLSADSSRLMGSGCGLSLPDMGCLGGF